MGSSGNSDDGAGDPRTVLVRLEQRLAAMKEKAGAVELFEGGELQPLVEETFRELDLLLETAGRAVALAREEGERARQVEQVAAAERAEADHREKENMAPLEREHAAQAELRVAEYRQHAAQEGLRAAERVVQLVRNFVGELRSGDGGAAPDNFAHNVRALASSLAAAQPRRERAPRRRTVASPVPIPRKVDVSSFPYAPGVGPLFARAFADHNAVPDLGRNHELPVAEALRHFWQALEDELARSVPGWTKTEVAGRVTVALPGLTGGEARALWTRVCSALTAGKGGPGVEAQEPVFVEDTRPGREEVRLVLWGPPKRDRYTNEPVPFARFRRNSSPGYLELLERQGGRPYFADDFVWFPRPDGTKQGFRLAWVPPLLLFREARAVAIRMANDSEERLSKELEQRERHPLLPYFNPEDARVTRTLRENLTGTRRWLEQLRSGFVDFDLVACLLEAFHHQRDAWLEERVRLLDGRELVTHPHRVLCLDPEDLRLRLAPHAGDNWRADLRRKLETLCAFERLVRSSTNEKIESGDRLLRRVVDARVDDGEDEDGKSLLAVLRAGRAIPGSAFFVEVSFDFFSALFVWAKDEAGRRRWGAQAVDALERKERHALAAGDAAGASEARTERKQAKARVRQEPFFEHSPRLLMLGAWREWPRHRRELAFVLLSERTPNAAREGFVPCSGKGGEGYKVETWLKKAGYARRVGPGGGVEAFARFLEDLAAMRADLDLQLWLRPHKGAPWRQGEEVLAYLRLHAGAPGGAYPAMLRFWLPEDLEGRLRAMLAAEGIDAVDAGEEEGSGGTAPAVGDGGDGGGKSGAGSRGFAPADLREARLRAGLEQKELAARLGVSKMAVCYWESGKRPVPAAREDALRAALAPYLDPPAAGSK